MPSLSTRRNKGEDEEKLFAIYDHNLLKRPRQDKLSPRNGLKESSAKKLKLQHAANSPCSEPNNWEKVYDSIKVMRSRITAPADTLGCEQSKYKETDPKVQPSYPPSAVRQLT
jgi:hypothetical protein